LIREAAALSDTERAALADRLRGEYEMTDDDRGDRDTPAWHKMASLRNMIPWVSKSVT